MVVESVGFTTGSISRSRLRLKCDGTRAETDESI